MIIDRCGDPLGYNIGFMSECVMLIRLEKLDNGYNNIKLNHCIGLTSSSLPPVTAIAILMF